MMRFAVVLLGALAAALTPAIAASGKSDSAAHTRSWSVTLSPSPNDLALAELRIAARRRPLIAARNVLLAGQGHFNDDYIAVARLRGASRGGRVLFVLAVDRSTVGTSPGTTQLTLQVPRTLGAAAVALLSDPFTSASGVSVSGAPAARCGLTRPGAALDARSLMAIDARGTPLPGFSTTEAVAAAYDAVCGLPYAASFKSAVDPAGSPCTPGALCCPPTAMCAPQPSPPPAPVPVEPVPPRCGPCEPRPGFACPLYPTPSICYAPAAPRPAEAAGAGAH
jgi:hypothetical protein